MIDLKFGHALSFSGRGFFTGKRALREIDVTGSDEWGEKSCFVAITEGGAASQSAIAALYN